MTDTDTEWLLDRIQWLTKDDAGRVSRNSPRRPATHQNIWQGSYDCWFNEQDKLDAVQVPLARMKNANDRGLIESRPEKRGRYEYAVWYLTEQGKQQLEIYVADRERK